MKINNQKIIKVGILVAYDWKLLKNSIPRLYESSEIICLALDKNRISWACNKFDFNEDEFYSWVKLIDVNNKIKIYEDEFSISELNARENCNRQRLMLSEFMGEGGWHIQVDADEYFLDFDGFVKYLKNFNSNPKPTDRHVNITVNFIPLFKKLRNGYLYVEFGNKNHERIPLATNYPEFIRARHNGHFNHITNFIIIHETWARGEEELRYKIKNWGHSAEELEKHNVVISYLKLWKSLDEYNYSYISNFHPVKANVWSQLNFGKGKNINEFIDNLKNINKIKIPPLKLFYLNNRNIARIRFYYKKIYAKKN